MQEEKMKIKLFGFQLGVITPANRYGKGCLEYILL